MNLRHDVWAAHGGYLVDKLFRFWIPLSNFLRAKRGGDHLRTVIESLIDSAAKRPHLRLTRDISRAAHEGAVVGLPQVCATPRHLLSLLFAHAAIVDVRYCFLRFRFCFRFCFRFWRRQIIRRFEIQIDVEQRQFAVWRIDGAGRTGSAPLTSKFFAQRTFTW